MARWLGLRERMVNWRLVEMVLGWSEGVKVELGGWVERE